ncbi:MAG: hypothetical protein ABH851_08810 [Methanobacteriota archaeon]
MVVEVPLETVVVEVEIRGEGYPEIIKGIEKRFQPQVKTFSYAFSDEEKPALD